MKVSAELMVVTLVAVVSCASGARILAVLPFAFKSHHYFFQAVLKSLALRGHEVVVYSPFTQPTTMPYYKDVYINTSYTEGFISYEQCLEFFRSSHFAGVKDMWEFLRPFTEEALADKKLQQLARSGEKFDLVITETFLAQEPFLVFGHIFNAPTIAFNPMASWDYINRVMGNSFALSYIPDFNFGFSNRMTFHERFINSMSTASVLFSYYQDHLPKVQAILDRNLKVANTPPLVDMVHNVSMVFLNLHPTGGYSRPHSPNMVPLGGIHVATKRTPLPQEIQEFMDGAKGGVIYFSLGTIVPDDEIPLEIYRSFINVFKKLKQRVLWKTKSASVSSDVPDTVKVVKWAPQQDVLGHPNCVLFMTHGGLLSQLEVIQAGVPVVAIPFFGDQAMNARFYEQKEVGVQLDFMTLSEMSISTAIDTVLGNPRYKENALQLSRVSRDLPMPQADLAVFWAEYVMRHKGAQHLRPASALLTWYQLTLLDVLGTVLISSVALLSVVYWTCRRLWTTRGQTHARTKLD